MSDSHQITDANRDAFEKRFALSLATTSATAVKTECPFCGRTFYLPVHHPTVCPHCGEVKLLLNVEGAGEDGLP